MPTKRLDTLPRTERFAKLDWPAAGMTLRLASALVTRSSCLLFQFCRIEAFSFLPDLWEETLSCLTAERFCWPRCNRRSDLVF